MADNSRDRGARVTTRTGDDGYTGLLGGDRVPKWDPRLDTNGTLDEATSALGLARALTTDPEIAATVLSLQHDLYLVMGELATPPEHYEQVNLRVTEDQVGKLDERIEHFKQVVAIGNVFVIPGGSVASGALDLARAIVRRAERAVAKLLHDRVIENVNVLHYLNRTSDLLFILARVEEGGAGATARRER